MYSLKHWYVKASEADFCTPRTSSTPLKRSHIPSKKNRAASPLWLFSVWVFEVPGVQHSASNPWRHYKQNSRNCLDPHFYASASTIRVQKKAPSMSQQQGIGFTWIIFSSKPHRIKFPLFSINFKWKSSKKKIKKAYLIQNAALYSLNTASLNAASCISVYQLGIGLTRFSRSWVKTQKMY